MKVKQSKGNQKMSNLTILGQKREGAITKDELEFFPKPSKSLSSVDFETHEFASLCPVTNQPDTYTVKINYEPREKCVESKSLKLYLMQWRNTGIFGEAVATTIADDLFDALDAYSVNVEAIQQIRGGLRMTTTATRVAADYSDE